MLERLTVGLEEAGAEGRGSSSVSLIVKPNSKDDWEAEEVPTLASLLPLPHLLTVSLYVTPSFALLGHPHLLQRTDDFQTGRDRLEG